MNWTVSIVGAFDRFNYGDVLFTKTTRHMIEASLPEAKLEFHALRATDLSDLGGEKTRPLSEIYRKPQTGEDRHLVLLAGGELLAPNWAHMAEHLLPHSVSGFVKRVHARTGRQRWTPFWRRVFGCPNLQPWTIDPADLATPEKAFVAYNAVGGTSLVGLSEQDIKWQAKALSRAHYLCVRDNPTAKAVEQRGLPTPHIAPDSAVIMSAFLSEDKRAKLRAEILQRSGLNDEKYLCVQFAGRWLDGHEDLVTQQLKEIHARTGLNVLSFAIGRASGHDDQFASAELAKRLSDQPWFAEAPHDLGVTDIMALIAGSDVYLGTSLHGYITAFSFGAARVGMLSHLQKVIGFRDAWDHPEMPAGVSLDALADAVDKAISLRTDASPYAQRADATYRKSFEQMISDLS